MSAEHDLCESLNTFHSLLNQYCTPQPPGFEPQKKGVENCEFWKEYAKVIPSCKCAPSYDNKDMSQEHIYSLLRSGQTSEPMSCTFSIGPTKDKNTLMKLPTNL